MHDVIFKSAKSLARAIKTKQISAVEVAQIYLSHINKVNPIINAIAQVDEHRILQDAKQADTMLAKGEKIGLLHGVPISIKDNILTRGITTTAGCKALDKNLPIKDATVVDRLKRAGAIILGKTNLPDLGMCWNTESTAYGRTCNPYDINRTPGGSSGGEAALLAAGGSALGIGNDGGGSIRLPAHFCGIAGYRPSFGLVPSTGLVPPAQGDFASGIVGRIMTIGTMARFVEDLIYSLPVIAGVDGIDPNTLPFSCPPVDQHLSIKGLRVAYYLDNGHGITITPSISTALKKAVTILADSGAKLTEHHPEAFNSWDMLASLLCQDGGSGIKDFLASLSSQQLPAHCEQVMSIFSEKKCSVNEFISLLSEWDKYRSKIIDDMKDVDVMICLVTAFPALTHDQFFTDQKYFASENYLATYSLMGWPSVVVRAGTSEEGLPIGIQIVAKHWQDHIALQVAMHIEQNIGSWSPPNFFKN